MELEGHMTLLRVMSMGCMAILHVIAPVRHLSHKVEAVTPLLEVHQDLGNEAQEVMEEEVDGRFILRD